MANISLRNLVKAYGKTEIVHGINLDIQHNEFIVLVGPSGCGKSTTLRMIAGLEDISGGEILIGDEVVNDLPPRKRNISMVFQNYALYPHMSVRENLGFGLKIAKLDPNTINQRVDEAADILGLSSLMDRTPAELSGGQRQRVAMGRAIVRHPQVFLFDEPLSNLDAKLRVQMRMEIKKLHDKVKTTIVYVTHDQVEAMTLADRIVVLKDGYIEQVGTPMDVFDNPVNTFVAGFIGSPPMNMIPAVISDNGIDFGGSMSLPIPPRFVGSLKIGQHITVGIRPDDITPRGHGHIATQDTASLRLSVDFSEPLGNETILYASINGQEIQTKMFNPRLVKQREVLDFDIALQNLHCFDAKTGKSLRG
ncbi:sn-glycerol-3-phosphate ABC transporter ATP-binding protein UgpC [Rhodobacteraceae bacterium]|nr:sn-glycerol-3-phosphate ABC transporter ATP-binding protein UgpC [Paracoccaceae bacterium]